MVEEAQEKPRKRWWLRWWAIGIWCFIAFVVLVAILSSVTGSGEAPAVENVNSESVSAAPSTPVPAAASSGSTPKTSFGNGTFEVGVDIEPGTYRTTGPSNDAVPQCSFARLKSAGGGMTDINNVIDIQNIGGPAVVTIEPTDGGFFSQLCNKWEKASSVEQPSTSPMTSFGNGVFQVGVDIEPGNYVSAGPEDPSVPFCSYARLKSAGGGMSDLNNVIDIQNVGGQAIVTIQPSDGGFFSQMCQTWTKR